MMKILILTSSNPNRIAGIVAKDLLQSLQLDKQVEAKLVVREYGKYKESNIISINTEFSHFISLIRNRSKFEFNKLKLFRKNEFTSNPKYEFQVYDQSKEYYSIKRILKRINFKPDSIIVLFMEKFLTFKNLYELNKISNATIYLYLMDMAAFTGGCHYAWNCNGYLKKCGSCPALFSKDPFDQSQINWKYKNQYISKTNIKVIIPSQILKNQVENSGLLKGKVIKDKFYIPINEEVYKPVDKISIRKELKLPIDKKIIFFGASSTTDIRKGFKELINSLKFLYLKKPSIDIHLVIAGHYQETPLSYLPFNYSSLGFLSHEDLPKAFQAADIFASPSLEDSGPMMVNQSLMCGTPVVSFEVGVAIDMVSNGQTGYVAKNFDCNEFADGLLKLIKLNHEEALEIQKNCRKLALKNYSKEIVCGKWLKILNKQ